MKTLDLRKKKTVYDFSMDALAIAGFLIVFAAVVTWIFVNVGIIQV